MAVLHYMEVFALLEYISNKLRKGESLTEQDALDLLSIQNLSREYYELLSLASHVSKDVFQDRGYIFAQIGLDACACSGDCAFCSLAQSSYLQDGTHQKTLDEILEIVSQIDFSKVTALFLMTTAEYPPDQLLEVARTVRAAIPPYTALVANTGDFDLPYALALKAAGFTGAYHIVRLREGRDTALSPQLRVRTLDAIAEAGLRLYYCLEPIGPEHSYPELVTEMMRARQYHVDVMAAMRRVNVPGSRMEARGMVDDFEYAKIIAVTRLVTMPRISMNVHEPLSIGMLAGVNQLYAEIGVNPRDRSQHTERSRGYSVDAVSRMLADAGYHPCIEHKP